MYVHSPVHTMWASTSHVASEIGTSRHAGCCAGKFRVIFKSSSLVDFLLCVRQPGQSAGQLTFFQTFESAFTFRVTRHHSMNASAKLAVDHHIERVCQLGFRVCALLLFAKQSDGNTQSMDCVVRRIFSQRRYMTHCTA